MEGGRRTATTSVMFANGRSGGGHSLQFDNMSLPFLLPISQLFYKQVSK